MSHGLIDPSKLPGYDLDLAGVSQAAADISSRGGSIRQAGTDVASSWSTLPASYESTGAESVYVAMNPVRDASDRVGGDLTAVASALTDWVTTVQPILTRLADLRTDAEAFVVEANTFSSRLAWTNNLAVTFLPVPVDNWWEDPDMVRRNADLVDQGYLLGEQLRVANEDLANAIRRSAGLSANAVAPAATTAPDNLQTDWGGASPREESCAEKTIGFPMHLTGGVLNGAWDMVGGIGMLVFGYDFKSWPPPWDLTGDLLSGDFQGAAERGGDWLSGWGQSWLGLFHLATGVSMGFMAPVMTEVVAPGQISDLKSKGVDTGFLEWQQQWMRDSYRSYIDLFGSFVGYHAPEEWWKASPDEWGEGWSDWGQDPGGTAGTSLFNIATLVLPTKGGGALLDGLKGGRGAEGLGDDAARGGAVERPSGSTSESNGLHLRSDGLVDDGARFGGAQDNLTNTLERSPLDDGGTLLDDIRGGDHLVRPDANVPRVHAGDPDVPQFHLGDPDAPTVHHGGGDANPPSPHPGEPVPGDGDRGGGSPGAPDTTGGPPPVAGMVDRIDGHDIWLPDGFKHEGNYVVRYEDGVPGSRIPAEDYLELREHSLHNEGSDTLVLGRFVENDPSSYIEVAKRDGAMYFDMGDDWNRAQDVFGIERRDEMFDFFNRPALDEAIQRGMEIRFTHDPALDKRSFLAMEAKYLEAHGYDIVPDGNGGWYATR